MPDDDEGDRAIAKYGDWMDVVTTKHHSSRIIELKYTFIGEITAMDDTYKIYKLNVWDTYKVGKFITKNGESLFNVVAEIDLAPVKDFLEYSNVFNVDGVKVASHLQGSGIATSLYKFFIKTMYLNILGDLQQYFGARVLWSKLSKDHSVVVDIIDYGKNVIVEKDVTIHHGDEDWDFDLRVWRYDGESKHIRLILKDVKI